MSGEAKSTSAARGRHAQVVGIVLPFVLFAAMFTSTVVVLCAGLLTWLSYEAVCRRNKRLMVCVVSCVLSWGAFEYFGGLILTRAFARQFEPTIDHRLIPGSEPDINQDGIRSHFEADEFAKDTFNILFLGDSFTYGFMIERAEDAFPGQVEVMLSEGRVGPAVRTINFGWPSSSPLLSLRLLREIGAKYKPDLVLLSLDMTDFHDDLQYRGEFRALRISPTEFLFRRLGWEQVLVQVAENRGRDLWKLCFDRAAIPEYYVVNQPLAESRRHLGEIEGNIQAIAAHCVEELDCEFMLLLLPRYFQYSARESPNNWERHKYEVFGPHVEEPFRWLEEFAEMVEFPCHALLEDFKRTDAFPTCFDDDHHWTVAGHRVAAEAIVRILEREGYVNRGDD